MISNPQVFHDVIVALLIIIDVMNVFLDVAATLGKLHQIKTILDTLSKIGSKW